MPRASRALVVSISLMSLAAFASPAYAQGPKPDDARARADAEFNEAKQLLDAGQVAAACAKFARSQELDPKLGRLLNLAYCHEKEGKTASAWREYNEATAMATQKGDRDRTEFARDHAQSAAKKLAFLRLEIPADMVLGAIDVDGDGVAREAWLLPMPLDPGDHKVTFTAPGKKARVDVVSIPPRPGIVPLRVKPLDDDAAASAAPAANGSAGHAPAPTPEPSTTPSAAPSTAPAPAAADSTAPARDHTLAYVVGGVGVVGLGVGTFFGLSASSSKSDADPNCPNKQCNAAGSSSIADARTAATLSTVGFGVGIVGVAVATYLFFRSPTSASSSSSSASARVLPSIGPGSVGVVGAF